MKKDGKEIFFLDENNCFHQAWNHPAEELALVLQLSWVTWDGKRDVVSKVKVHFLLVRLECAFVFSSFMCHFPPCDKHKPIYLSSASFIIFLWNTSILFWFAACLLPGNYLTLVIRTNSSTPPRSTLGSWERVPWFFITHCNA